MEKLIPDDLITLEEAAKLTGKTKYFFVIAGGNEEIDIYHPFKFGMEKYNAIYIQAFIDNNFQPIKGFPPNFLTHHLQSFEYLHISKMKALLLSNTGKTTGNSALEKLKICEIEMIFDHEANRQTKEGFEIWKKNIERKFHTGIRAGIAVIAYCMKQNKKITKDELQDLLQRPQNFSGAEDLQKFNEITKDLIEDIYAALPNKYRHGPGEKK